MQPCSQPRYALTDWLNGMSGDELREMMLRACSPVTVVRGRGASGTEAAGTGSAAGPRRRNPGPRGLGTGPACLASGAEGGSGDCGQAPSGLGLRGEVSNRGTRVG